MSCHKVRVVELEMPLVVELGEGGTEGVLLLEVDVVHLRLGGRVPAVLTHIHLRSSLLVSVVMGRSMDFQTVGLQRTSLGE